MLCVSHFVGPSPYGAGLMCGEAVPQGAVILDADDRFTRVVTDAERAQLSPAMQRVFDRYGYRGQPPYRLVDAVYYNTDDSRFMNHSETPSTVYDPVTQVYTAARDLLPGDELTCDYRDFCEVGDSCFDF